MGLPFSEIAVIGAGQMGLGIAQVCATYGSKVCLQDISDIQLEKAKQEIQKSLNKMDEKGKLKEKPQDILSRIQFVREIQALQSCQLVIEAATENFEIKSKIFKALDEILPTSTMFASNTSSISITKLAAQTKRPQSMIGIHFMNPVPVMKLVEVIVGEKTNPDLVQKTEALIQGLEKISILSQDRPGFVVNRILMPMINEAIHALHEGVATKEHIDTGMKLGTNHPMGPLELADLIGLDTCLSIMDVLYDGFRDEKYKACKLLKEKVGSGHLGRKTGQGFYTYQKG